MYWDDSMIVKAMDEAMLKYKVILLFFYPSGNSPFAVSRKCCFDSSVLICVDFL